MTSQPLAPLKDTNAVFQREYLDCRGLGASGGIKSKRSISGSIAPNEIQTFANFMQVKPLTFAMIKVKFMGVATNGTETGQSLLSYYSCNQRTNGGPQNVTPAVNVYNRSLATGGISATDACSVNVVASAATNGITLIIQLQPGITLNVALNYFCEITIYNSAPL